MYTFPYACTLLSVLVSDLYLLTNIQIGNFYFYESQPSCGILLQMKNVLFDQSEAVK
jgi:hypothetical protein